MAGGRKWIAALAALTAGIGIMEALVFDLWAKSSGSANTRLPNCLPKGLGTGGNGGDDGILPGGRLPGKSNAPANLSAIRN